MFEINQYLFIKKTISLNAFMLKRINTVKSYQFTETERTFQNRRRIYL